MRDARAGSPARPCAVRSEGNWGAGSSARVARGCSRSGGCVRSIVAGFESAARGCGGCGCEWVSAGATKDCFGRAGATAPPFRRRPRPPRRPRRLFFLVPSSLGAAAGARACSSASSPTPSLTCSVRGSSGALSGALSEATSPALKSGVVCASLEASAGATGSSTPNLARASAAFFFQSLRRKRCAAIVYHFTASSFRAAFSSIAPSSHATMASRVRWKSSESFAGASGLFFALRIRA